MKHSIVFAATLAATLGAAQVQAKPAPAPKPMIERTSANPAAVISSTAMLPVGSKILYLSGSTASPIDPAKTFDQVKSVDDLGDTKTQTISALAKIKTILADRGYAMSDLIKLTLFVAADPKLGKMDFAGANEGFKTVFKTADNPNTVARSTFQVAALAGPYFLIEIEAIAAKKR